MKAHRVLVLLTAVAFATVGALARQTDAPATVFSGSVVDAVTGWPIAGARVRIAAGTGAPPDRDIRNPQLSSSVAEDDRIVEVPIEFPIPVRIRDATTGSPASDLPRGRTIHAAFTDSLGRFEFRDFEPGIYTLAVDAVEYVYQVYGQAVAFGVVTPLDLGDENEPLTVRLTPTATLAGSVTDTDDQAVGDLSVYLLRAEFTEARARVFRMGTVAVTDAEGRYMLTNFPAGRYYVATGRSGLEPGPGRGLTPYHWTYYPGVSEAALAGSVDLLAGTRLDGIDLVVTPAEVHAVRGRVVDHRTGEPPPAVTIRLVGRFPFNRAGTSTAEDVTGRYDPDSGAFEFEGIPDARYRIDAALTRAPNPEDPLQVLLDALGGVSDAHLAVEVAGSDVEDLELRVPAVGSLQGEVRVEGGQAVPDGEFGFIQIGLQTTEDLQPAVTRVSIGPGSEAFEFTGSFVGRYRVLAAGLPGNFYVSEVSLNGARVSDGIVNIPRDTVSQLDIQLDPDGGEIQGRVVDEDGQPLPGLQGLLLPDPLPTGPLGVHKEVSVDSEGGFVLRGIPPGAWRLYVWNGIDRFAFFDPDVLRRSVADATPVRIDEGSRLAIDIETIRLP